MLLALLMVVQAAAQDSAASPHQITLPRLDAEAVIDGRLDEPAWSSAIRLNGFHQYQPVDGRPAEERTEVLVWYGSTAIYFGIIAHDQVPGSVRATVADRDNLDSEDRVTIYLDTFHDRRRAYFFTVNPLGSQEDGVRSEGGFSAGSLVGGTIDKNPDYVWDSKGQVTDSGYVVEVRIPFKSLRYPGKGEQAWGLNFSRKTQRTGYEDTWTDVRRANASFLTQEGTATGISEIHSGISGEFQPFATAQANGSRTASGFERENVDPSFGANLRVGVATNLSLDATYNPDFSQIESDASLVTVNERFALFYPEKRPFFLEGIELFSTPNQLVYTRQIVDPIAGGKVTAKFGRTTLATLVAGDQANDPTAAVTIARLRRDLGTNSLAGVTFSSREANGAFNRVIEADTRLVFGKIYFFGAQAGGSWTRDAAGASALASPIWEAEVDRTGRSFGFNYKLTGIGEDFSAQSGFVPRNNIIQGHLFNRFSWYGSRGALLETFQVIVSPTTIWKYTTFLQDAIEGTVGIDGSTTLRGGWKLTPHVEFGFTDLQPEDYANYEVDQGGTLAPYQPLDGIGDAGSLSFSATTPTLRLLNANAKVSRSRGAIFAEGSRGYETRVTGGLTLRPTGSIRLTSSATYSRITRDRDGSEYARTIIPRIKLEYQPMRSLFFRVVTEYVAQRRAALEDARTGDPLVIDGSPSTAVEANGLRMDWLASFEPVPGTVAFLGYGSTLEDNQAFGFNSMSRTTDGFFLKLAYQFRY
jgi:hypothetical protein